MNRRYLMRLSYDPRAPKRATNLTVNAELLAEAKSMDVNLSATLEQALIEKLREKRREQWLADNQAAIEAYNEHVKKEGVFSDGLRNF